MLEIYPDKVLSEAVVPLRGIKRSVCPRLFESKNCNTSNCSYLHPDFLNEHWVVPDIICHKWFQGCCDRGDRCWNQHASMRRYARHFEFRTNFVATSPRTTIAPRAAESFGK